ncbi:MAG: zinc ribbon domain-containing protein [Muribaculaceae bacterium]|nr:zinc ribbon domain-containing protein [Muribaculaceae bacterium]
MALIKCSECGQMVSDKASVCPKCGNPINVAPTGGYQQPNDKKSNTWLYVLTGVLGVIAIIVAFSVLSTSTCQEPKTSAPVAPAPADTVSTPPT